MHGPIVAVTITVTADAPRLLVVNADDFGLTPGINAGMLEAHRQGILTSVSLFAHAPATKEAIALARRTPTLGVGVHLALVDAAPLSPAREIPSLLAADARLHPGWRPFLTACLRGRVALDEVERELGAQIEHLRAQGLRLTHLDAHKHVHAWPPIFAIVCRLALRHGIGVVRLPREVPWCGAMPGDLRRAPVRRQALENLALLPWAWRNGATLAQHGLATRAFFGRVHTGHLTEEILVRIIQRLPAGVSELMTHVGHHDAALQTVRTRLRQSREEELRLLCSPRIRGVLSEAGVTLVRQDEQPVTPSPRSSWRNAVNQESTP